MAAKILFFYLKTGGGHLAPVRALAAELHTRWPGKTEPVLLDGLEHGGSFARYIIEDGYRITQARAKWIYETAYAFAKFHPFTLSNNALVNSVIRKSIERKILEHRPQGIVISHFFLISPVLEAIRRNRLDIPAVTIVTDPYTAHSLWFLRKDQTMVVFSERVKNTALRAGIPAERIHVLPFILNAGFSPEEATRRAGPTRDALGYTRDQKVVLLLGGGDGMPRGYRITRRMIADFPEAGVILVCGKNEDLQRRGNRLMAGEQGKNLRVFGFVNNVPDLIAASDAVLTKGGASTLMEILALGKTPVVTTYIWEQEKGNVEFVVNEHRGVYEKSIAKLPAVVSGIFSDAPEYRRIRETNERTPIKNGTAEVAEMILKTIG